MRGCLADQSQLQGFRHWPGTWLRCASGSGTATPVFVRLLSDPCQAPFCRDSVAVRHEVSLFKQMTAEQLSMGVVTAQQASAMADNLSEQGFGHCAQVDQVTGTPVLSVKAEIMAIFSVALSVCPDATAMSRSLSERA